MSTTGERLCGLILGLVIATFGFRAYGGEAPSRALPPPPPPGPIEKTLSAADVMRFFDADYLPQVRECYLQHAARQRSASGRFTLGLIIKPVGTILRLVVTAPGVRGRLFEDCVRTASEEWHFPDRGGFTAVEIPVILVKTRAPGAGPMRK